MLIRIALLTLTTILFAPPVGVAQSQPQDTAEGAITIGLGPSGIQYSLEHSSGLQLHIHPYACLTLPHFIHTCARWTCLLAERNAAKFGPSTSADSGLLHLYNVAKRCEDEGDFDMACNCYTEIVRIRPDCELATTAEFQCRRLQLVKRVLPGLQRNNFLSTLLPK